MSSPNASTLAPAAPPPEARSSTLLPLWPPFGGALPAEALDDVDENSRALLLAKDCLLGCADGPARQLEHVHGCRVVSRRNGDEKTEKAFIWTLARCRQWCDNRKSSPRRLSFYVGRVCTVIFCFSPGGQLSVSRSCVRFLNSRYRLWSSQGGLSWSTEGPRTSRKSCRQSFSQRLFFFFLR